MTRPITTATNRRPGPNQHGPAVVRGQFGGGEGADPGEGDLAQREHTALAGDQCPRQEDHCEGKGLGHDTDPIALQDEWEQGHDDDEQRAPHTC